MGARTAIIIGAGPAGLTAAYELLSRTDIKPIVYEASGEVGGISKTIIYKGNRMDLGGHRFFSKSDRVMDWWTNMLPLEGKTPGGLNAEESDDVMLIRNRLSRIFYGRRFYDYPVALNTQTVRNLGLSRIAKIACSYAEAQLRPREERTLEDFLINRFGRQLYRTFFEDYTRKVWGVGCEKIGSQWGAQRIKGLSVGKAIGHWVKSLIAKDGSIGQKGVETSLIGRFMYPKLGAGQMWDTVAAAVRRMGGEIRLGHKVTKLGLENGSIHGAEVMEAGSGQKRSERADYYFSTMPIKELVVSMDGDVAAEVQQTAAELAYRDFISVGLLLKGLRVKNDIGETGGGIIKDNWIYIQEKDVKIGRLQVFNNWSPYMVRDADKVWVGAEYFCSEGDELWRRSDYDMAALAAGELERIGFIDKADVVDSTVVRMAKVYPAYWGGYERLGVIQEFMDKIINLFLTGRNGMHRYNNQDHSMLTAMVAVDNINQGVAAKDNIWAVNTEGQYHEERPAAGAQGWN